MKKVLLLTLGGMLATSAVALEPQVYADAQWLAMSPNGQYAAGDWNGNLVIVDFVSGQRYDFAASEASDNLYIVGSGNAVSDNGVVLCSNKSQLTAAYWYDGDWYDISVPKYSVDNQLHGVTADGSRIVGIVDMVAGGSNVLNVPAYWDRNEDGSYGEYQLLPFPEADFRGAIPQYVTATCVSEDGKTIVGQYVDRSGRYCQPIVYKQATDGSWSYSLPLERYYDVSDMPENPGTYPAEPNFKDYTTPELYEAWYQAYKEYMASGYKKDMEPDWTEYASPEDQAIYIAVVEQWKEDCAAWMEAYEALEEWNKTHAFPEFQFNDVRLTVDGKFLVTTYSKLASGVAGTREAVYIYTPWVVNVETGEVTEYFFGSNVIATQIINEKTILAFNGIQAMSPTGYIVKDGECWDIASYLKTNAPQYQTWVNDNINHPKNVYDPETDSVSKQDVYYTGMAVASRDMSVLGFWTQGDAWGDSVHDTYAYVVGLDGLGAVNTVATAESHIGFDAAGNLVLSDDICSAAVYDLSGRLVIADANNAGELASGIYIVRALRNDGKVLSVKICK